MSRDSICDFVLSITTSNVVWWDKNGRSMFQEVIFGKGDEDFTTTVESSDAFGIEDYG
jgi:hypothetical protein